MIEVEPMLDELSIGHEGRLAWVNNCKSNEELYSLICSTLSKQGYETATLPKLHKLALVSKYEPKEYARRHSMLAVQRVAAKRGLDMEHGAENSYAFSKRLGMLPQRSGAYCCIKCVEEDLNDTNDSFSWYRRKHHLTGVDWCSIHSCALSRIDSPVPFTKSPHIWLTEDKLLTVDACEPNLPEDGFLRRYVEIATRLLDRDRPFLVENICQCLAKRAKHHNFRIGKKGQRPLISDRLLELAPADWLKQHLPGSDTKTPMSYFNRLDSLAVSRQTKGAGDAYSMVIAVLYESAEEALSDLSLVDWVIEEKAEKNKTKKRGVQFWEGLIWQEYLAAKGIHSEMANSLGIERKHLGERMSDLGLPSLRNLDNSPGWRAFVRFMEGEGFAQSCAVEKIDQIELESQLRNCSARVYKAIKNIRAMTTKTKRN